MEDIFLQALVTRSQVEAGLIDQLPDDVRAMVTEKLHSMETEQAKNPEIIE